MRKQNLHICLWAGEWALLIGRGYRWCALVVSFPGRVLRFFSVRLPPFSWLRCGRIRQSRYSSGVGSHVEVAVGRSYAGLRTSAGFIFLTGASWERPHASDNSSGQITLNCRTKGRVCSVYKLYSTLNLSLKININQHILVYIPCCN